MVYFDNSSSNLTSGYGALGVGTAMLGVGRREGYGSAGSSRRLAVSNYVDEENSGRGPMPIPMAFHHPHHPPQHPGPLIPPSLPPHLPTLSSSTSSPLQAVSDFEEH